MQAGNRFLGSLKSIQTRALCAHAVQVPGRSNNRNMTSLKDSCAEDSDARVYCYNQSFFWLLVRALGFGLMVQRGTTRTGTQEGLMVEPTKIAQSSTILAIGMMTFARYSAFPFVRFRHFIKLTSLQSFFSFKIYIKLIWPFFLHSFNIGSQHTNSYMLRLVNCGLCVILIVIFAAE